jgi:hypothetical protein
MNYENRTFYIFGVNQIDLIDFNQVLETSKDTLRLSVDKTKTFIKFDGEHPEFLDSITTKEGPYTYEEIVDILMTPFWSEPNMSI